MPTTKQYLQKIVQEHKNKTRNKQKSMFAMDLLFETNDRRQTAGWLSKPSLAIEVKLNSSSFFMSLRVVTLKYFLSCKKLKHI